MIILCCCSTCRWSVAGFTCLPTFGISQDFIETMFSKISRWGRFNNNPTSKTVDQCFKGCKHLWLWLLWMCVYTYLSLLMQIFQMNWFHSCSHWDVLAYFCMFQVIWLDNWRAGSNVRTAQAIVCPRENSHSDHCYMASFNVCRLQMVKDRGGLITATDSVFHIIKRCEQIICTYLTPEFIAKPKSSQCFRG